MKMACSGIQGQCFFFVSCYYRQEKQSTLGAFTFELLYMAQEHTQSFLFGVPVSTVLFDIQDRSTKIETHKRNRDSMCLCSIENPTK